MKDILNVFRFGTRFFSGIFFVGLFSLVIEFLLLNFHFSPYQSGRLGLVWLLPQVASSIVFLMAGVFGLYICQSEEFDQPVDWNIIAWFFLGSIGLLVGSLWFAESEIILVTSPDEPSDRVSVWIAMCSTFFSVLVIIRTMQYFLFARKWQKIKHSCCSY